MFSELGAPPEGAVIELVSCGQSQPDVRNSRPWALVEADGTFTLSTYEIGDGAPAGEYDVLIRWPPDASEPSFADRLSGAYSTVENSQWTFTVKQEENAFRHSPEHILHLTVPLGRIPG